MKRLTTPIALIIPTFSSPCCSVLASQGAIFSGATISASHSLDFRESNIKAIVKATIKQAKSCFCRISSALNRRLNIKNQALYTERISVEKGNAWAGYGLFFLDETRYSAPKIRAEVRVENLRFKLKIFVNTKF